MVTIIIWGWRCRRIRAGAGHGQREIAMTCAIVTVNGNVIDALIAKTKNKKQ
jgi:hypothetical protein